MKHMYWNNSISRNFDSKNNKRLRASSSSASRSKPRGNTPRAEFLIPERYEPPPPDCSGSSLLDNAPN